jgi:hypothetical protein
VRLSKFAAGLLLAPIFAVAMLSALGATFLLFSNLAESRGDWEQFEAQLRHYSDRLETAPDGSFELRRAPHPVAAFLGIVAGSWAVALLLGYLIERLRRDVWSARPLPPIQNIRQTE